jgi:hypothetical protein
LTINAAHNNNMCGGDGGGEELAAAAARLHLFQLCDAIAARVFEMSSC